MAPILIDNRGLTKLIFISVLTTVIIFAVGFFSGYKQAETYYTAGSEVEILALPAPVNFPESDMESQLPATILPGAEIDVDMPRAAQVKPPVLSNADNVISPDSQIPTDASTEPDKADIKLVASATSDGLNRIKYSIQVAVFGNLASAENMVKKLQLQRLDAYVTDSLNDNKNRYNVRFGYFYDKQSAMAALEQYNVEHKSDSYLVNFSDENMINFVDEENLKAIKKDEEIKKGVSSKIIPLDATSLETDEF